MIHYNVTADNTIVPEEHIGKTYDLFGANAVCEIRAIHPKGYLNAGYLSDKQAFVKAALNLDRQDGTVYVTLNPVDSNLLAKINNRIRAVRSGESTPDKHIVRRRWMLIDCDPVRPADIPATNEEKAAAWDKLQEIRVGLHSRGIDRMVVADSANGYHLLVPINLPADDGGLVEKVLNALQLLYGDERVKIDTSVFNPARITKLYGTLPHKGDGSEERPLRRSMLLDVPEDLTPLDTALLEALAAELPEPDEKPKSSGIRPGKGGSFDVPAFLERHDIEVQKVSEWDGPGDWKGSKKWIVVCPWNGHTNGSCHIIQAPNGMISARCKHDSCQGYKWQDFRKHYEPEAYSGRSEVKGGRETGETGGNQADRLIHYALETGAEWFCDQVGAPHALVDGEPLALNSRCYPWLRGLMWDREEKSPTAEAVRQAAGQLAAFALRSEDVRELHTRAAFHEGAVYYQLGRGRVVEIDEGGYRKVENPPVLFRTLKNLKPLPDPVSGGSLEDIRRLVNIKDEGDRRLFDAYLVTALLPHIGRYILEPTGQQGSGKTVLARVVKRLLDPSVPEAVRVDHRDFLQKAAHAYIIMLDNLNSLPEWAEDTLCRLVTGESDSKRALYTDDEDVIIELKRLILMNGINTPSDRGDVRERTIPLELERIPDNVRMPEKFMWSEFERIRPAVQGAIFTALSGAIKIEKELVVSDLPRLADWGRYAIAAYKHFGWGEEQFRKDWEKVSGRQTQAAVEGSPVAMAIIGLMKTETYFRKSSSQMLEALEGQAETLKINYKREKTWPKSSSWLWRRIKEVQPALGAYKINAKRDEDNTGSYIILWLDGHNPDDGGSIIRNAATGDPATGLESGSKGDSGSILGENADTIPRTKEENSIQHDGGHQEEEQVRRCPENAATAATAATDGLTGPHGEVISSDDEGITI